MRNPKTSSKYNYSSILPLLASVWLINNIFCSCVSLIWGGNSANLSRIGTSFSLKLSIWDNKLPSLFDMTFIIGDFWPRNLLGSISVPIVAFKRASLKQNAEALFTKRIGSSWWKFEVLFFCTVISNSN